MVKAIGLERMGVVVGFIILENMDAYHRQVRYWLYPPKITE